MKKLAVAVAISTCLVGLIIAGFPQLGDAAVIYGCYGKVVGVMRIVSGPGQCSRFENPISWNEVGPAGPQGEQGPIGPPGAGSAAQTITVGSISTGALVPGYSGTDWTLYLQTHDTFPAGTQGRSEVALTAMTDPRAPRPVCVIHTAVTPHENLLEKALGIVGVDVFYNTDLGAWAFAVRLSYGDDAHMYNGYSDGFDFICVQ